MPITQTRMIQLIESADEYKLLAEALAEATAQLIADCAAGLLPLSELALRFTMLRGEFRPSAATVECIVSERVHFKERKHKNAYAARKARERRGKFAPAEPLPASRPFLPNRALGLESSGWDKEAIEQALAAAREQEYAEARAKLAAKPPPAKPIPEPIPGYVGKDDGGLIEAHTTEDPEGFRAEGAEDGDLM